MKLKFTRKTWYFCLLVAAAATLLNGLAVLTGQDFSFLEMCSFCLTALSALFLAAEKGSDPSRKRNYFGVFLSAGLRGRGPSPALCAAGGLWRL